MAQPEVVDSINLCTNIPVAADGTLSGEPALTRPDDSVTLRTARDCSIVVSACPQDIKAIDGHAPTSVGLEVPA